MAAVMEGKGLSPGGREQAKGNAESLPREAASLWAGCRVQGQPSSGLITVRNGMLRQTALSGWDRA